MKDGLPPTACGTIGEWPLTRLLVYALDARTSGRIVLTERVLVEHTIRLERGGITAVETPWAVPAIGRALVDLGVLDERLYRRTSETLGRDDDVYGEYLVSAGIVHLADLQRARAEGTAKAILRLTGALVESAAFSMFTEPPVALHVPPIDPLPLVWQAISVRGLDGRLERGVDDLRGFAIALHPRAPIGRFRFGPDESAAVAEIVRSPGRQSGASGANVSGLGREAWRRLLGVLLLTRSLYFGDEATLPVGVLA